jgi:hypothetical protein
MIYAKVGGPLSLQVGGGGVVLGVLVPVTPVATLVVVVVVAEVVWVGIVGLVMVEAPNGLGDVVAQTLMLAASMRRTRTMLIMLRRSLFNYVLTPTSLHASHWRFGKPLAFFM